MKQNNCHRPCPGDERTTLQENPICACHQNEELSSKDDCSPQKWAALSLIDLSRFPDGTRVVQVWPDLVLDIPDSSLGIDPDGRLEDREQGVDSEEGYLSEEHRREQLVFLNG